MLHSGAAHHRRRLRSALIAGEVGTFEWDTVTQKAWGDQNFDRIFGVPLDAIHPDDRGDC